MSNKSLSNNQPLIRDPYRHWIAIIGMGAGGAGLFSALLERLRGTSLAANVGFLLIDKRAFAEFGRGTAWSSVQHTAFRANMRINTIRFKARTIRRIVEAAGLTEVDDLANLTDDTLFHQRVAIGNALHEDFLEDLKIAKSDDIPVEIISSSVVDIIRKGIGFIIQSKDAAPEFAHTIVLALGNVPNYPMNALRGVPGYFHNPWSWKQYDNLEPGKRAAVIGLGPTAVDTIIALDKRKAKHIAGYSRSGRIQYPRPFNAPHILSHLSKEKLAEFLNLLRAQGNEGLSYEYFYAFLVREFQDANACPGWEQALHNSKLPPRDALLAGLKDADKQAKWYAILKELDEVTPYIWNSLNDDAKRQFMTRHRADHMNLSFGMASVQADRLLKLINDKKLSICGGGTPSVSYIKDKKHFIVEVKNEIKGSVDAREFDIIVNCTGIGSDINQSNSTLIRALHDKAWISAHPHGGAKVDWETGQILSEKGLKQGELYSLAGSLTYGTHLLTHCLGQVWTSGERTAQAIALNLAKNIPSVA